ncbi:hypothetical protein [Litorihabitans aurantiacus]|uniref:Uncharacterized protein n=1 Tax=Litorihabitans aurantiacus TaxID=1930061 RepID=A0AA37XF41_9MICO|nr:hypothetical protein [Litorihabitans aurantiacus]GMA32204.1 hypothetical protein GCM10025875_21960 [Litorihabitans aurantiacus]
MPFATLLGLVLGALGLFALGNGVLTLWRSSPGRRRRAVVAEVVPQARDVVLHLDVALEGGPLTDGTETVRVPARHALAGGPVEIGQQLDVVLDGRRKLAWVARVPRSLRALGVVSVVLGSVLVVVALGLFGVGATF